MDDHPREPDPDERVTAPMQAFGRHEVGIRAVITLVGLLVAYVVPFFAPSEPPVGRRPRPKGLRRAEPPPSSSRR